MKIHRPNVATHEGDHTDVSVGRSILVFVRLRMLSSCCRYISGSCSLYHTIIYGKNCGKFDDEHYMAEWTAKTLQTFKPKTFEAKESFEIYNGFPLLINTPSMMARP
jgi:hypothetical protein